MKENETRIIPITIYKVETDEDPCAGYFLTQAEAETFIEEKLKEN